MNICLTVFKDFICFVIELVRQPMQCHVLKAGCSAVLSEEQLVMIWLFYQVKEKSLELYLQVV